MAVLSSLNHFLWSFPLLVLLMGTHLFFTLRLHFPQLRILKALKYSITPEQGGQIHDSRNLSGFSTLATTLAATLGTGNIIGVSTAVALGGPGAVFWCWLTGLLGMATAYAECYLSLIFREKDTRGEYLGGPMYVIRNGMKMPGLAKAYALFTLLAALASGCTTQSNALSQTVSSAWNLSPHLTGMAAALLTGSVLLGGIKAIGSICEKIVPVLGLLYIAACLVLLVIQRSALPSAIHMILSHALLPQAAAGGAVGAAFQHGLRYGIARGLFTNEAGMGTAAITASASSGRSPVRQAYISMTAVFWDTVVMCLLSGLVIVTNVIQRPESLHLVNEAGWAHAAFTALPAGGSLFLSLSLTAFALTTLIGWSYLGEKAFCFLWGKENISVYRLLYIVMIYIGAVIPLHLVWECTDLINALMLIPNLLSLFFLCRYIRYEA